jgi:hypothetical protein
VDRHRNRGWLDNQHARADNWVQHRRAEKPHPKEDALTNHIMRAACCGVQSPSPLRGTAVAPGDTAQQTERRRPTDLRDAQQLVRSCALQLGRRCRKVEDDWRGAFGGEGAGGYECASL